MTISNSQPVEPDRSPNDDNAAAKKTAAPGSTAPGSTEPGSTAPPRKKYVKAVGPRLRIVLATVFVLMALIGATSAYLASITGLEFLTGNHYQDGFYLWMFFGHVVLGVLLITPFLIFGIIHLLNTRNRKNRRAVRAGYALFTACIAVLVTGVLLVRIEGFFDLQDPPWARALVYWLHAAIPVMAGWLYWLHRLAGPKIRWRVARAYGGLVAGLVVLMVVVHAQDPRQWNSKAPKDDQYFFPSLVRTTTENFIPAEKLMNDQYCLKCHADIHAGWEDSVHRFSSFNNPTYLASVRETRDVLFKRDGNVQASRWCAGCHDPVPFLSGAFDDPNFDDVQHPTAHAGITCTVCHSIVESPSHGPIGNADYVIDEPIHYPFASSENPLLQWVNNQLIKAKPAFHKRTFLKPLHESAEFCASCHKVHLPKALNHYKDFLRGQNHYDSYHLSGVSGHGSRSFYYPPKAKQNCSSCHMPLTESSDFGAKRFDDSLTLKVHNHLFPSANTGIAWLRDKPDVVKAHQAFLEGVMRVDVFGIREGDQVDSPLTAPLRPQVSHETRPDVPTLKSGQSYVLDTVIRTLTMGHHFTQGTVDSNEVWLDVTVTSGDRIIGRSGGMNARGEVDPWSHFVNVFLLDKDGNRINRRNPQDIVVPLYNHQIPPGAGQTVHYGIKLPDDLTAPVTVDIKLQYRKFDTEYMDFVTDSAKLGDLPIRGHKRGEQYRNDLPITTLAKDRVTFPVEGVNATVDNPKRDIPDWQRWNDYGIGLLLKGEAELRQAEFAFKQLEQFGRYDGPLNRARVYWIEGRLDEAVAALNLAREHSSPAPPPWTLNWLAGVVNLEQSNFEEAEQNFRNVLESDTAEHRERGFDFSQDYVVRNLLGESLFHLARKKRSQGDPSEKTYLQAAIAEFQKTLKLDSENLTAHHQLSQLYSSVGKQELADKHRKLHERYRPDNYARGRAVGLAREKYPAADAAAEAVVVYELQRAGNFGLPADVAQ